MMPSEDQLDFERFMRSIWKYNVGELLFIHKRYRIFFWEFGPTLLEHLNNRSRRDYAKYALLFTYCAMITSAIALRHRKLIAVAATTGVIVLGMASMVLVDYCNTVWGEGVITDERCAALLQDLGKMPKYWWWPWGPKIEGITIADAQKTGMFIDQSFFRRIMHAAFSNVVVNQLRIKQYKYLYDYQQIQRREAMGNKQSIGQKKRYEITEIVSQTTEESSLNDELLVRDRLRDMFRSVIANYDGNNMSLGQVLKSFDLSWLLMGLDVSMRAVESGVKSRVEHDDYFKDVIRDIRKLSLKFHPDKTQVESSEIQITINDTKKALENIHNYIMSSKRIHEKHGYIYRLFAELPIDVMSVEQDLGKVVNMYVNPKLFYLSYWEEGRLMEKRNEYSERVVKYLGKLEAIMKENVMCSDDVISKVSNIQTNVTRLHNKYIKFYKKEWVDNLELLSVECKKFKELEIIKPEVEKLLQDAQKQHKFLLSSKSPQNQKIVNSPEMDRIFIAPILRSQSLIEMYSRFILWCLNNREPFIVDGNNTYFVSRCEEHAKKLLFQDLRDVTDRMLEYCFNLKDEPGKLINWLQSHGFTGIDVGESVSIPEIKDTSIFGLNRLSKLLAQEFKPLKTFFEEEKDRREEGSKEYEKFQELIKQKEAEANQARASMMRAEDEAQQAEEQARRAEEQAKRETEGRQKAEEQARREAADRQRAEEQARQEAADRQRAEEQAKQEAANRQRAEKQARQEAANRQRAEEQAKQAEKQARQEAADRQRAEKRVEVMCALSTKVSDLKGRDLRAAVNNSINKILEAVLESNLPIKEGLDMIMEQVTHHRKQVIKDGGVRDALLQKVLSSSVLSDVTVSSNTDISRG